MHEALCALQQPLALEVPKVGPLVAGSIARADEVVE
jgi:hypothetical protein